MSFCWNEAGPIYNRSDYLEDFSDYIVDVKDVTQKYLVLLNHESGVLFIVSWDFDSLFGYT